MKLFFLGTGTSQGVPVIGCSCKTCVSSDPRDTRFRTHVHVEMGELNIQIDAAPEFRIQALQHSIPKVDLVVLTHGHSDHILGMDDMRRYCDLRKGDALPVYTNEEGELRMRSIFGYAIGERPKVPGYPAFLPERIPEVLELDAGVVRSTVQSHGSFDTLGVVFEEALSGKKLAYFTDCDSVSDEAVELAKGADVAVLDALRMKPHRSHMSIEEAIGAARRIGAKQTYLIHMTHEIEHAVVDASLPEGVNLAYDNLVLEV